MANRKYTTEHIEFIKENIQGTSFRDLTNMFNKEFGMDLSVSKMVSVTDRYGLHNGRNTQFSTGHKPTQFMKGRVPWNKGKKGLAMGGKATQFKKGDKAWNWVPIGTERVSKDGYIEIKVQDGHLNKNWKFKHVALWEKANGPVPKGHAILFGDGDKRNFDLDNFILVSRKQLVRLNQKKLIYDDANLTKAGIIIADIYNKIGERKRGNKK